MPTEPLARVDAGSERSPLRDVESSKRQLLERITRHIRCVQDLFTAGSDELNGQPAATRVSEPQVELLHIAELSG
jgi:hypothetical protein